MYNVLTVRINREGKMTISSKRPKSGPESSSLEKCSFVCHLLIFPLGFVYLMWVLLDDESLEHWNITYYPPKSWSIYIPVSALCIFLATPLLYASFNSLTVPRLDSSDTWRDDHTRRSSSTNNNDDNDDHVPARCLPPESSLPEICDLDPASLTWYYPPK